MLRNGVDIPSVLIALPLAVLSDVIPSGGSIISASAGNAFSPSQS